MNYFCLPRISRFIIFCTFLFGKRGLCDSYHSENLPNDTKIYKESLLHNGSYSSEMDFIGNNDKATDESDREDDDIEDIYPDNYFRDVSMARIESPLEDDMNVVLHHPEFFDKPDTVKDLLMENFEEDFDLADIISLSESFPDLDIDLFTEAQQKEIVDQHNIYRSNFTGPIPQASDMNFMEYNKSLENQAKDIVKSCKFEQHLVPFKNLSSEPFGANFYIGRSRQPSRALRLWYKEHEWYSFENASCSEPYPKHMCGHFTQMLWGESNQIGCARRSYCFPRQNDRLVMSCLYYPAGNYLMSPIYRVGKPCTRCRLQDGNLCHKNLCVDKRMCRTHTLDCRCKTVCKNCVDPNPNNCKCEPCKLGWDWEDCSFPCMDSADYFGVHECPNHLGEDVCRRKAPQMLCRKSCGICTAVNTTQSPRKLCCKGKMCKRHYILDVKSCECVLDCPSQLCLHPSPKLSFLMRKNAVDGNLKFRSKTTSISVRFRISFMLLCICFSLTIIYSYHLFSNSFK